MKVLRLIFVASRILTVAKCASNTFHKKNSLLKKAPFSREKNYKSSGGVLVEWNNEVSGGELDTGGGASMSASVFNLVNNIAGAGILTLSSGMAKGSSTGIIPAIAICILFGTISAHTFVLIGKACEITQQSNFKGLWNASIGSSTTYLVDTLIATQCFGTTVIYSSILGDVSTSLLKAAGISSKYNQRAYNILGIMFCVLFPLGLIRNLAALAFTSILGISSVLYTVLFIVVRYLDRSYALPDGKFLNNVLFRPSFQRSSVWNLGCSSLVLASNFGLGFFAHYNSPAYYRELKNTNSKRFSQMVSIGYFILIALYITTMLAGYQTFGDVCSGNILLNYSASDKLSTLARVATLLSITFGFPLVLRGCREAVIGAAASFGFKEFGFPQNHVWLVAGLLTLTTSISLTVKDVSFVVGLSGATLGCFLIFICPVVLYLKALKIQLGWDNPQYKRAKWNLILIPFGLMVGSLGVFFNLKEHGIIV